MSMRGLYCATIHDILKNLEREIKYFESANVEVNDLRQLYKDLEQFALNQIFNLNSEKR